jgi:hypothetical protein
MGSLARQVESGERVKSKILSSPLLPGVERPNNQRGKRRK